MLASAPNLYYRLDDTAGPYAQDATGSNTQGVFSGGVTLGAAGPVTATNRSAAFDGKTGTVGTAGLTTAPQTFSTELWFSTTTTKGGKLIGFENARSGKGSKFDRQVYMNANGTLSFTSNGVVRNVLTTSRAYNNGGWHHVVATESVAGMKLYVDGVLAKSAAVSASAGYNGYWRIGGGSTGYNAITFFKGSIDEVAVYPSVLSATTVANHFKASPLVHQTPDVAPVAAFTSSASGLAVTFDGSGSTDSDGVVAQYSWNFGDGTGITETTPTHTHPYSAAGTYTVTLRVTDNAGVTSTTSSSLTVSTAVLLAQDTFNRSVSSGWGHGRPWGRLGRQLADGVRSHPGSRPDQRHRGPAVSLGIPRIRQFDQHRQHHHRRAGPGPVHESHHVHAHRTQGHGQRWVPGQGRDPGRRFGLAHAHRHGCQRRRDDADRGYDDGGTGTDLSRRRPAAPARAGDR